MVMSHDILRFVPPTTNFHCIQMLRAFSLLNLLKKKVYQLYHLQVPASSQTHLKKVIQIDSSLRMWFKLTQLFLWKSHSTSWRPGFSHDSYAPIDLSHTRGEFGYSRWLGCRRESRCQNDSRSFFVANRLEKSICYYNTPNKCTWHKTWWYVCEI